MTTEFSSTEWKHLLNAPQLIYHLLRAADRGAIFTKRSEAKALEEYLSSYRGDSALVKSIIAGQKDADEEIKASRKEAQEMIEQVGALLEAKADEAEGDAVREFLLGAGTAIAGAAREQTWAGTPKVSEGEEKTLAAMATALKATEDDKRRRRAAAAAEAKKRAEEAQAKREAEAKKRAEEAQAKREAEAKKRAEEAQAKREAEAKKRAEEAQAKREAEAKKRTEEARAKREAEAKKAKEERLKREAEAKKRAEEARAKREAEALKREAEAAKRELEEIKAAAEAAEKAAEEIYVVKKGDTLSGIAKAVYGNAGRWREIFEANRDVIDKPNLIRPGWKLRIPR